jgi:hypothetical protein
MEGLLAVVRLRARHGKSPSPRGVVCLDVTMLGAKGHLKNFPLNSWGGVLWWWVCTGNTLLTKRIARWLWQ